MADIPVVIGPAGAQPQSPASLRAQLVAAVAAINPGYTANLPGLLIEDIASTDVGAIALCDAAFVDLINCLTPFGANEFLLNQLGQLYGVTPGLPTNTSANITFEGPPGFVIPKGFVVSDGTHQYVIQDGGVVASSHFTDPLFALATVPGTWAVPSSTVDQIVSSVPSGITLSCSNYQAGTPGGGTESIESYRSRVLQAGRAASTGMASLLKTELSRVSGVPPRLIAVKQNPGGGWEVIVGGGDPYQVAYAIYTALFDVSNLVGSTMGITLITNANPGVVYTDINHGFTTGAGVAINGVVGMTGINGLVFTATVIDEKSFSIGINTTSSGAYGGGGVVTPNFRNQTVSLQDYPDTYEIIFVAPPAQTVAVTLLWNTDSPDFVSGPAVNALGTPAIVTYINAVPVTAPINLFDLERAFQEAVASVLPSEFLSRMVWTITINGIATPPNDGTALVYGDPESYFLTDSTLMTVSQG